MHIKIRRGLNIPIEGLPKGELVDLAPSSTIALDLSTYPELRFKLLVKVGDEVIIGEPIAHDKKCEKRLFVAPAAGKVVEIRRGLKRRLLSVVIEKSPDEKEQTFDVKKPLRDLLCEAGLFGKIRRRPANLLAHPDQEPRSIFVRAIESAPIVPSARMQIAGQEELFQLGLDALASIAPVHLVGEEDFPSFAKIEQHTATGPHPISSPSIHIEKIDPIRSSKDVVWTLTAHDLLSIGYLLKNGKILTKRIIGVGGPALIPDQRRYLRLREGQSIASIFEGRTGEGGLRFVSGDPLMGSKVELEDHLGIEDFAAVALSTPQKRQFLSFLRPGFDKYTASRTYHSRRGDFAFDTNNHGEERAFIDGRVYDKVMPLRIPTMPLVKSILSQDWDQAEELGLLEVEPADFALPAFVCPSKIEMVEIVREGLRAYAEEVLH